MNRTYQTSIHNQEQVQRALENAAREQVAYNAIIKAEAFMRMHNQPDLADKWVEAMLEIEAPTNLKAEIEQ